MIAINRLLHLSNITHHNGMPEAETVTKLQQLATQLHLKMISDKRTENPLIQFRMSKSPTEIAPCHYNSAKHTECCTIQYL
jgi:Xaa-Pro aminopeptidase